MVRILKGRYAKHFLMWDLNQPIKQSIHRHWAVFFRNLSAKHPLLYWRLEDLHQQLVQNPQDPVREGMGDVRLHDEGGGHEHEQLH